ncbi:MAG: thioredoxin domain-containing protein [Candidatus Solibacter usitatus]|nr:thioredoxin domain-containing protein [Candidatus Solibacter usitatus]
MRFISGDAARPFRVELYVSPDSRFLSSELLDSTLDPGEDERRKDQALWTELTQGDYVSWGPANAPVTLTVFSDFQCPYCARAARILTNDVLRDDNNVRLIFRHYPLPNHAWARTAAEATACAQEQHPDFFWKLHDFLFERQTEFAPETLRKRLQQEAATFSGFDSRAFQRCLSGTTARAKVDRDIDLGTRIGITGTPTLFVNSHRVAAVVSPEQIRTLIRQLRRVH